MRLQNDHVRRDHESAHRYHFGALEEEERREVEAHLVTCVPCVREFVALKRSIETSADVHPSARARARLREAVASELRVAERRWAWWERPLAIAVAASIVLAAGATTRALTSSEGAPPARPPNAVMLGGDFRVKARCRRPRPPRARLLRRSRRPKSARARASTRIRDSRSSRTSRRARATDFFPMCART